MATVDTLQAEARVRPRMAVIAAVAGVFTLLGSLIGRIGIKPPSNVPAALLDFHEHPTAQYVSGACSVIGLLAVAILLDFLYRATRARNPGLPGWLRPLPLIGGIGVALMTILSEVALTINAKHFATQGSQTYEEARKAIDASVPPMVGLLLQLVFTVAIVMIAVNAMRVGLLTRFLGYLGAISGALFLLPLVPIPIVQVYWLGALALLFAGRLPNGTPPAWQSGEAVPWPSTGEQREARVRAAEARRGGDAVEGSVAEPADDDAEAAFGSEPGPKRKRKRR